MLKSGWKVLKTLQKLKFLPRKTQVISMNMQPFCHKG